MSSKSKTKGNTAERELCKILGDNFGGSFTRVPSSGAITGGKNAFRRQTLSDTQNRIYKGDIIPPDHMPKLVLESKFYSEFRFHQLLQPGGAAQLDTWIGQCLDAVEPGDFWCVCFKINLRGWFIALPASFCDKMTFHNSANYTCDHGRFYVTDLKSFVVENREEVLRLTK